MPPVLQLMEDESIWRSLVLALTETPWGLTVMYDFCWPFKRLSKNSLHGWGILAVRTSEGIKIISCIALSRYCSTCCRRDFKETSPPHECTKNFDGGATHMEMDALQQGYQYLENKLGPKLVDAGILDKNTRVVRELVADGDSNSAKFCRINGVIQRSDFNHLRKSITKQYYTVVPKKDQCCKRLVETVGRNVGQKLEECPADDERNEYVKNFLDTVVLTAMHNTTHDNSEQRSGIEKLVELYKLRDYSCIGSTKEVECFNSMFHRKTGKKFQIYTTTLPWRLQACVVVQNDGYLHRTTEFRQRVGLCDLNASNLEFFKKLDDEKEFARKQKQSHEYKKNRIWLRKQRKEIENKYISIHKNALYNAYESGQGITEQMLLEKPACLADADCVLITGVTSSDLVKAEIVAVDVMIVTNASFAEAPKFTSFIFPNGDIKKTVSESSGFTKDLSNLFLDGDRIETSFSDNVFQKIYDFIDLNTENSKKKVFLCFDGFSTFCKKFDERVLGHAHLRQVFLTSWKLDLTCKELPVSGKFPKKYEGASKLYMKFLQI